MSFTPLIVRDGNNAAQSLDAFQDASGVYISANTTDSTAQTYRASMMYTLGVATPTAIVVMQGSATKTIRIRRITLCGSASNAGAGMKFKLSRRSSAGTVGAAVLTAVPTQGKNDTLSAAPTLTISTVGTANYTTLGTLVSIMDIATIAFPSAPVVTSNCTWIGSGQAYVLRGTSDYFTIDGGADSGGDTVPAAAILLFSVEWIEDNS